MNDNVYENVKIIADTYGINEQLNILQEELAELIQAVSKYRRNGDVDGLIEELADVHIMWWQIVYLLDKQIDDDICYLINQQEADKTSRQLFRIKYERN